MDADIANELFDVTEASRAARRRNEPDAGAAVEARYDDMLEALEWHLARGDRAAAHRLADALVDFWISSGRIPDGDAWFDRLLAEAPAGADAAVARSLHEHGYLIFWAGDYQRARRCFAQSRSMASELADPSLEALALAGLARVALTSDAPEALPLLRAALALTAHLPDDDAGRGSALHVLGPALQMAGDYDGARDVIERRLALARAAGNEFVVWSESANLATTERRLGNLDRAEELALQAVCNEVVQTSELYLAWTLNTVAAVAADRLQLERAAVLLAAADELIARAGGEWPPDEIEQYRETRAAIAAGLPDDVIAAATARGAAMTPGEVVLFATAVPVR